MEFLHTMVRVTDIDASLRFYCEGLGLKEIKRSESEKGRFTLVFLAAEPDIQRAGEPVSLSPLPSGLPMIELTYNWPAEDGSVEDYGQARNFGHLAYRVENLYETCERLAALGVTLNRPPRDGHMAFVRSPDNVSIELLQKGDPLPVQEPWAHMENIGAW